MIKSQRKYFLLGNFRAKYFGEKSIDNSSYNELNFDIEVYDAIFSNAKIVEQAVIDGNYSIGDIFKLIIPEDFLIYTKEDTHEFVVSGREIYLIRPNLSLVSEEGLETFGTIDCQAFFDVYDESFLFNPIHTPDSQASGSFPGYSRIIPKPRPVENVKIGLKAILTNLLLLVGLFLTVTLSFIFFSLFHPVFLLILLFAGILIYLWEFLIVESTKRKVQQYGSPILRVVTNVFSLIFLVVFLIPLIPFLITSWLEGLIVFAFLGLLGYLIASLRAVLIWLLGVAVIFALFFIPIGWSSNEWNPNRVRSESYQPVVNPQVPGETEFEIKKEEADVLRNTVSWLGPQKEIFTLTYELSQDHIIASEKKRNGIKRTIRKNEDFSPIFYSVLENESMQIGSFLNGLDSIRNSNNMSDVYFQNVIVNFVQQVPYAQLMPTDCEGVQLDCVEEIKYGFYTPTEFLHYLKGDCDTKSLLLFSIFDYFDFDILLLGSLVYQHAMVAVPSTRSGLGYPIRANNKVFYPWESTTSGWQIGQMPPSVDNLIYWDILLITN